MSRPSAYQTTEQPHYSKTAHCTVGDPSYISDRSGKQLKYRPHIPKEHRFEVIREEYGKCSLLELSQHAHVSLATIKNDIREWRDGPEFAQWLKDEWVKLFRKNTIADLEKLKVLSGILGKYVQFEPGDDKEKDVKEQADMGKILSEYSAVLESLNKRD